MHGARHDVSQFTNLVRICIMPDVFFFFINMTICTNIIDVITCIHKVKLASRFVYKLRERQNASECERNVTVSVCMRDS